MDQLPVYLDCNATTPVDPEVLEIVHRYLDDDYGNAGSRTHEHGMRAKNAVDTARKAVADLAAAEPDEVIFTSGATEGNNLALLGLAAFGEREGRKHIVSTQIEHKSVLEPLAVLRQRGFEVVLIPPTADGFVDPEAVRSALRPDTLLVSVMHVNNETGVMQPIEDIAEVLRDHEAYFHVDAAQGFGKAITGTQNPRIDLLVASAHKLYGPKGVGCLVARRRDLRRPPLTPILVGGGQERGLRAGTAPVHLIAGFGKACELAAQSAPEWMQRAAEFKNELLSAFAELGPVVHGDQSRTIPTTINLRFPGLDSEAVMLAVRGLVSISNGSACTSAKYKASHVLTAMGLAESTAEEAVRISWCHLTPTPPWAKVCAAIRSLR